MIKNREITFLVPGAPVPKARARTGRYGTYTPKRTKDYEAAVALHGLRARAVARMKPFECPVQLKLIFVEDGVLVTVREDHDASPEGRRYDISNVLKSIEDGLNGVLYRDDRQVVAIEVISRF